MFNFAAGNSLNYPPAPGKSVTQPKRERKTDMNDSQNNPQEPEEEEQPSGSGDDGGDGATDDESTTDGREPIPDSDPPIIIQGGG